MKFVESKIKGLLRRKSKSKSRSNGGEGSTSSSSGSLYSLSSSSKSLVETPKSVLSFSISHAAASPSYTLKESAPRHDRLSRFLFLHSLSFPLLFLHSLSFPLLFSWFEMALFNPHRGQGSRSMLMMRVFSAQLLGLLACLANTTLAQFDVSEAVTASASFPDVGITCIGNLAVFFSCLIRGRLHVEMGARDLLATITGSKLRESRDENGYVLTTSIGFPDVVMLSNHTPESSMRQFIEYIKNTHDVKSTLLRFHSLRSRQVVAEICISHDCMCIVIEGADELIRLCLARRMPGVLKQLSGSECLLPCLTCLRNGCHGCNHGMLHVEEKEYELILTEGGPREWPIPAVCEILDQADPAVYEERRCICIPVNPEEHDDWTKMLIRSLKTKDKADRGVTNLASDALGKYISQSGVCHETEVYSTVPLIVPRLAEVLINIILTVCFRVDGFSSALVARRVIRDYIVDSRGNGIAANVFLKKCEVHSNAENTDVCQVLTFRGNLLTFRKLSSIIGCVNLNCSISWAVLIAIPPAKWYDTLSMPPSKATIVILIAAIGIAFLIDCLQMYLFRTKALVELHRNYFFTSDWKFFIHLWLAMILEMVYIISGSAILATLGIKGFGRWTYSAIQLLVWVKWGLGSSLHRVYSYDEGYRTKLVPWAHDVSAGHGLMCASAFLLNAILAGVRGHWY